MRRAGVAVMGRGEVVLHHSPSTTMLTRHPGTKQEHHHRLPSLLIPVQHQRTVTGTAAVAVAPRVALPVLTVAAVVVHSEGVGGLEGAGGGGEGRGL